MRSTCRSAALGGLGLLLALSLARPAAAVTIDGIAATVNGEVITLLELEKEGRALLEKRLPTVLPREKEKVKREVLRTVLDQLILRDLQLQRAKEIGVRVSDEEVDRAVARIMESNNLTEEMFERALAAEGLTREQHRRQVSDQVVFTKLMQREVREKTTVTPEEVQSYYNEHREEYFQPERIRVRHLLVKTPADGGAEEVQEARRQAIAILEEVRAGGDFAAVAERLSADNVVGGDTVSGWLRRGEFLAELEEVAFSLPVDQVSEPIRSQSGFHLIQVTERQEASYVSLGAVADSIEESLMRGKMEESYKAWLQDLRDRSQVEVLY